MYLYHDPTSHILKVLQTSAHLNDKLLRSRPVCFLNPLVCVKSPWFHTSAATRGLSHCLLLGRGNYTSPLEDPQVPGSQQFSSRWWWGRVARIPHSSSCSSSVTRLNKRRRNVTLTSHPQSNKSCRTTVRELFQITGIYFYKKPGLF